MGDGRDEVAAGDAVGQVVVGGKDQHPLVGVLLEERFQLFQLALGVGHDPFQASFGYLGPAGLGVVGTAAGVFPPPGGAITLA